MGVGEIGSYKGKGQSLGKGKNTLLGKGESRAENNPTSWPLKMVQWEEEGEEEGEDNEEAKVKEALKKAQRPGT